MNYILVINGTSIPTEHGDFVEMIFQHRIQSYKTYNESIDALEMCLDLNTFAGIYKWDVVMNNFVLCAITMPDEDIIKHINNNQNEPRQNTDSTVIS